MGGLTAGAGKFVPKGGRSSLSCPIGNSFLPGTAVVMADGGLLPIEDIEVGDQVLATDPETGVQGPRTVMATIVGDGAKQLVDITAAGATVTATDGHPFWVVDLDSDQGGVWVDAVELQPGDHLVASGGQPVAVTAVATYEAVATVYNRTVEDTHTYHIAVGGTDTLVHNCGKGYKGKHRLHVGKHHADEPVSPKTLLDRARFALNDGVGRQVAAGVDDAINAGDAVGRVVSASGPATSTWSGLAEIGTAALVALSRTATASRYLYQPKHRARQVPSWMHQVF